MRAVLGLLLILGGAMTGYLVLTGKLPNGNVPFSGTSGTSRSGTTGNGTTQPPTNPGHGPVPSGQGAGGPIPAQGSNENPLGLPTMQYLRDIGASQGGYK